jgi:hypothetical protein
VTVLTHTDELAERAVAQRIIGEVVALGRSEVMVAFQRLKQSGMTEEQLRAETTQAVRVLVDALIVALRAPSTPGVPVHPTTAVLLAAQRTQAEDLGWWGLLAAQVQEVFLDSEAWKDPGAQRLFRYVMTQMILAAANAMVAGHKTRMALELAQRGDAAVH